MHRDDKLAIVVFTNRKDFCLSKICISSIRHFYPDVNIFLVKDFLNGDFNTKNIQRAFGVEVLKMPRRYYGWGAAKVHFLFDQRFAGKKFLCLDADTIFTGKVLDSLQSRKEEFLVNAVAFALPIASEEKDLYIDPEKVTRYYPDYQYPGYFFNTGQLVGTPGLLSKELLAPSFDVDVYPFYTHRDAFKLVDQAVLNAVLPVYSSRENKNIGQCTFMQWSVSFFNKHPDIDINELVENKYPWIIHYAGDVRSCQIEKMRGFILLQSFRKKYYQQLSGIGIIKDKIQDYLYDRHFLTRLLYRKNWLLMKIKKLA